MKDSNHWKYSLCFLAALLVFALAPGKSYGGAREVIPAGVGCSDATVGQPISWPAGAAISYMVNPNGVAGLTTGLQQQVVVGAVDDSFRAWKNIAAASISFSDAGTTQSTGTAGDGVNTISFQDTNKTINPPLPPSILAITIPRFSCSAGSLQLGGKTVNVVVGQIYDADIVFNPLTTFSPIGVNNAADLVAVLTHEVGHLLGLDHTGVLSSIMNPFGEAGTSSASRTVQSDDMVTAASIYPAANFSSTFGAISGKITSSSGAAVESADVVASSVPGGVPVASQLSGADGSFSITGLPPGNYRVMVEPLDGPVTLANFPGFYSSGQTNFATIVPFPSLPVAAGQTSRADTIVAPPLPGSLNVTEVSSSLQGQSLSSLLFSNGPQFFPRGKAYQLLVAGTNVGTSANFSFSAPSSDIAPQGGTIDAKATVGGLPILQQNLTISLTAALGPSSYALSTGSSTSVMPGGIVVTVNPQVTHPSGNPVREGAGYATTLAPGGIISIFGTDLAFGQAKGGIEYALDPGANPNELAYPTSLGGVSVKIGDRLAPLQFVSPTQINALLPYEVTGSSVPLTVITGPNASGNTVTLNLSPTAPGIISGDGSGSGQGAILNNSDHTHAAPVGYTPVSHPAHPGDVIVIYALGLGTVTPAIPSGAVPGAGGTAAPKLTNLPRVIIGGQTVPSQSILSGYVGLAPPYVGLYQVPIQLPPNIPTGSAVSVQIVTFEGQTSNTVTMAVTTP